MISGLKKIRQVFHLLRGRHIEFDLKPYRKLLAQITLFHIDKCWAEYLDPVGHIRDGIHLFGAGGQNPLNEFHRIVAEVFHKLLLRINENIVETFNLARITEDGIDTAGEGLARPTSTWTYLINDNPFGDFMKGLREGLGCLKGLKRALTDKSP